MILIGANSLLENISRLEKLFEEAKKESKKGGTVKVPPRKN